MKDGPFFPWLGLQLGDLSLVQEGVQDSVAIFRREGDIGFDLPARQPSTAHSEQELHLLKEIHAVKDNLTKSLAVINPDRIERIEAQQQESLRILQRVAIDLAGLKARSAALPNDDG